MEGDEREEEEEEEAGILPALRLLPPTAELPPPLKDVFKRMNAMGVDELEELDERRGDE